MNIPGQSAFNLQPSSPTLSYGGFQQNWFLSIFLQDYSGYWYLAYVAVVFGILVDVAFNRGRITQAILSGLSAALTPT